MGLVDDSARVVHEALGGKVNRREPIGPVSSTVPCPEPSVSSMIIVMRHEATETDIAGVVSRLEGIGCEAHVSRGQLRTVIGAIGDREQIQTLPWEAMAGVEKAVPGAQVFPLRLPGLPV